MSTQIVDSELARRFQCRDKAQDAPCCLGLIAALRQALQDEHGAVNAYMEIAESYPKIREVDVKTVIQPIRDEEIEHEKELTKLISELEKACQETMTGNSEIGKHQCQEHRK